MIRRASSRRWWWGAFAALLLASSASARRVAFDRVVVRYSAQELGGAESPRFLFDRELAFLVRLEAIIEDGALTEGYIDRHLRATVERHVAEKMLASLQIRGSEPSDLVQKARATRAELERLVGVERFAASMRAEGIAEEELMSLLEDRVRAMTYVDREVVAFLRPSEDNLYAAFRSAAHPYRTRSYQEAREAFLPWYLQTRYRSIILEYLQSRKSRTTIVYL